MEGRSASKAVEAKSKPTSNPHDSTKAQITMSDTAATNVKAGGQKVEAEAVLVAAALAPKLATASSQKKKNDTTAKSQPLKTAAVENTGNDQVSVDIPRKPLLEQGKASSMVPAEFLPPPSAVRPAAASLKSNPSSSVDSHSQRPLSGTAPMSAVAGVNNRLVAIGSRASTPRGDDSLPDSSSPPSPSHSTATNAVVLMDEQSLLEEKLRKERSPLTDKYGSFIVGSDTCLADARRRLHTALEQTRQLRNAFTERVYGKYRVCLTPPASTAQILTHVLTDPAKAAAELEQEIERLNTEKTIEKKEASKLNTEIMMVTGGVSPATGAPFPAPSSSSTPPPPPGDKSSTGTAATATKTATTDTPAATANSSSSTPGNAVAAAPTTTPAPTNQPVAMMNPLEIMNAENADQLMYISAGLSLIVLPEQNVAGMDLSRYRDRGPTHPVTGQRVKGISAAAAAAGEVMLDRTRKGAALRAERKRRRSSGMDYHNWSRLEFLANNPTPPPPIVVPPQSKDESTAAVASESSKAGGSDNKAAVGPASGAATLKTPPTTSAAAAPGGAKAASGATASAAKPSGTGVASSSKRPVPKSTSPQPTTTPPIPSAAANAIRARVQATMSLQTLLSISPSGEELRTDGNYSAATLALMERGVGTQSQQNKAQHHQRFKHPYPESQGGRRRALQNSGKQQGALLHPAYSNLALPPLPTAKERRTRKRVPHVVNDAGSARAKEAIKQVLRQFDDSNLPRTPEAGSRKRKRVTEIGFLHGIQSFDAKSPQEDKGKTPESNLKPGAMDPMLAFHVMQAVGLIQPSPVDSPFVDEVIFPDNLDTSMFAVAEKRAMGDEGGVSRRSIGRLKRLHQKFTTSTQRYFCDSICNPSLGAHAIGREMQQPNHSSSASPLPLRGGGEALNDSSESGAKKRSKSPPDGTPAAACSSESTENSGNSSAKPSSKSNQAPAPRPAAAAGQQAQLPPAQATNVWDPSHLVLMNPGMARRPGHMNGAEHFHPNAIQLANQLRISRLSTPHHGGDLADYVGGLHPQPATGYDWSAIGAASAAAAASAHSFAALGINPHRNAMMNFPLQDRARAMLRDQSAASAAAAAHAAVAHRHQQALAYLSSGHGYPANAHFGHMGGAMMNPFMGQAGIAPVGHPAQQASRRGSTQANTSDSNSKKPAKDDSKQVSNESEADGGAPLQSENASAHDEEATTTAGDGSKDSTEDASRKRKFSQGDANAAPREKQARIGSAEPASVSAEPNTTEVASISNRASSPVVPDSAPGQKVAPVNSIEEDTKTIAAATQGTKVAHASTNQTPGGLQFFVPPAPADVPTNIASLILEARSHEAVELAGSLGLSEKSSVVGYFVAVGTTVPIPKTIVANLLKDRLNAAPLKSTVLSGIPQSSRDAAVATILLWLWKYHEDCFQRAFAKSGRIDVEPECKWLITTAVEKAAASLGKAVEDKNSGSSTSLAIALMAIKSKGPLSAKGSQEKDSAGFVTATLDLLVVATVSKGLTSGLKVNAQADATVHRFNDLLDYLDESRKCALHSKSQERALLAALISRKATMSLSFSHAYVSAMVRAGEALGHGDLFEVIQNEEVNVSTMIPYDVFTDETGAWEDPCRPVNGFNANLTGDDLMRQAHARAMIQKSLKKLQDRHNIKGGTPVPGAYTDPPTAVTADSSKSVASSGASTPRGWLKRRSSFSEPPVQPGTGSAVATSWSLYDPKHYSAPLAWRPDKVENTPYGKHNHATRPRSLSLSQFSLKLPGRARGRRPSSSSSVPPVEQLEEPEPVDDGPMTRSTREIQWVDVAGIFQNVARPGTPRAADAPITPRGRTIFAPLIRQVNFEDLDVDSDDESDDDEDLNDETVLARHQIVLDRMKTHLSAFLEARQKTQEKRKSRTSKT